MRSPVVALALCGVAFAAAAAAWLAPVVAATSAAARSRASRASAVAAPLRAEALAAETPHPAVSEESRRPERAEAAAAIAALTMDEAPVAVAPARRAREDVASTIAASLRWEPSSRDAEDLARWLERARREEREMLDAWGGAGSAPPGGAEAFNRAAVARERELVERFGARAAEEVARRAALRRIDPATGEIFRVDHAGRRVRDLPEPPD